MALPNDSQHTLQGQEDDIAHEAIQARYDNPSTVRFRRVASKTVVSFGPDDPSNPVNWSEVPASNPAVSSWSNKYMICEAKTNGNML